MSIPSRPDDFGDDKQSRWNDDHKGPADGDKDEYSKHGRNVDRSDDADTHNPGEALARFDFSRGDFGSHGADHSDDIHGALASMSSDDALEYAIGQMGPADHSGVFDVPADTSPDADA